MSKRKSTLKNFYHEPKEVALAKLVNQLNVRYQMDFDSEKTYKVENL
jgi:hypothetical protein